MYWLRQTVPGKQRSRHLRAQMPRCSAYSSWQTAGSCASGCRMLTLPDSLEVRLLLMAVVIWSSLDT